MAANLFRTTPTVTHPCGRRSPYVVHPKYVLLLPHGCGFPFERFIGVLKKYVHNRAWPEGSITKGYGIEEVIEFCIDFIPNLNPIGVPESWHEGRLSGKRTLGKKAYIGKGDDYFRKTHYIVL